MYFWVCYKMAWETPDSASALADIIYQIEHSSVRTNYTVSEFVVECNLNIVSVYYFFNWLTLQPEVKNFSSQMTLLCVYTWTQIWFGWKVLTFCYYCVQSKTFEHRGIERKVFPTVLLCPKIFWNLLGIIIQLLH